MGIPRFFKLYKNKQFNYNPLYYDEQKENLQGRIKDIEREMGVNTETEGVYVLGIKGQMRGHFSKARQTRSRSNVRLILIILALCLIAYIVFYR